MRPFENSKRYLDWLFQKLLLPLVHTSLCWRSKSFWLWLTYATSKLENKINSLTWTSPGTCARMHRNERLGKSYVVLCFLFAFPWHNSLKKYLERQIKVKKLSFSQKWKVVLIPQRENQSTAYTMLVRHWFSVYPTVDIEITWFAFPQGCLRQSSSMLWMAQSTVVACAYEAVGVPTSWCRPSKPTNPWTARPDLPCVVSIFWIY